MLKHFKVNNFKNFKDDLNMDFSDVNGYKFSQDCITNDLIGKMIIYGKNGSGKTNLSKALCDLKETLTMSNDIHPNQSFISNANSDTTITTFSYTFLFNNKNDQVIYEYQKSDLFSLSTETLKVNDHILFSYDFIKNEFKEKDEDYFHNSDIFTIYQNNTNPSLPFLRWIVNNGSAEKDSIFNKIYNYAIKITQIFTPTTASIQLSKIELDVLDQNVNNLEDFLNYMGIPCKLSMEKLPDGNSELYFVFRNRKVSFLENASSGTLSLFNFYIRFLMPHKESSILYFDEFDAFFHFELSEKIVQYIKDKYKNSLVIFTTHNTNLMSNKIMRPDTLFLLSTNGTLTPLCKATDRELREGHNLGKLYMNGEFDED
mgnify:FL=1